MFYRVSLHQHAIGDVISPGTFGGQYRTYRPGGPYPQEPDFTSLLIEVALESARKSVAAMAPSRLDSVFCCSTLPEARRFQANYRSGAGHIFGIVAATSNTPTFRGNFDAISTAVGPVPYVDYLSDWARDYWTTSPTGMVEVLIGGPARVVSGPL